MAELIRVPEIAAGATEATLLEWNVAEGDAVSDGDVLALLETDKAQVEITAEAHGTMARLLVAPPSDVLIGAPIAVLAGPEDTAEVVEELIAVADGASPIPKLVPEPLAEPVPAPLAEPVAAPDAGPAAVPAPQVAGGAGSRVFVSPIARRMLKEAGIDPVTVHGTGPGGRIVRRDVEAVLASEDVNAPITGSELTGEAPRPVSEPAGVTTIPHTRLRRTIARRLAESKQQVPHFYLSRTVCIDELQRLRGELNALPGVRISVNDLVVKAVARTQAAIPDANVVWAEEHLIRFGRVDVAVAVASDRGLVTPVVREADRLSLGTLSEQIAELVTKANAGSLTQADLEGGAITVTNLGMFGVDWFSAIINPPHAAILAVGAGKQVPVVRDGAVAVATEMNLVLSVDHRAIDGALAAAWMLSLVETIEHPHSLLV